MVNTCHDRKHTRFGLPGGCDAGTAMHSRLAERRRSFRFPGMPTQLLALEVIDRRHILRSEGLMSVRSRGCIGPCCPERASRWRDKSPVRRRTGDLSSCLTARRISVDAVGWQSV